MASEGSEEKLIPPTARKLQNLRKEGQVPRSKDFQSSLSLLAVMAYLIFNWRGMAEKLRAAFLLPDASSQLGFSQEYARVVAGITRVTAELVGPIFILAIAAGIFGSMIDVKGFLLQTKSLVPDLTKVSPAKGFGNLFSVRSLIDLIKGLIVIVIILGGNIILFRAYYNDIMWSPSCGAGCVIRVFLHLFGFSVAFGIVIVIILAFVDIPLTRWHFKRDNYMSVSELKREQREEFGDPHIRQERRRLQIQQSQASEFIGIHRAQIVFAFGDAAIAISFVQGRTEVPLIAAKTRENGVEMIRRAAEMHLPVIEDPLLVAVLVESGSVGEGIPEDAFGGVAMALIRAGLVKLD